MTPAPESSAVLLLTCPDQKGIVAAVSGFLTDQGANITHAEQHADQQAGIFFQRVEFEMAGLDRIDELASSFEAITTRFGMEAQVRLSAARPRVAVLVSKEGHCLFDLLSRWRLGEMPGELALVASNHEDHRTTVERSDLTFHHLPVDPTNRLAQQEQLLSLLRDESIDLVVMARYMQILPDEIVREFPNKIINIHHSFLPAFPGGRPYHQAHQRGVKLIGATAHYATAELDEGPIIEQDVSRVTHRHTVGRLVQTGRDLEMIVLARAVQAHLEHRILVYGNKTVVFS